MQWSAPNAQHTPDPGQRFKRKNRYPISSPPRSLRHCFSEVFLGIGILKIWGRTILGGTKNTVVNFLRTGR